MSDLWYGILGFCLVAYFVLGGLDQGVAMLLPALRGDGERRAALNAIGPMFLGNEVWAVGAAGVLVAAFPRLDGELYGAAYPAVIAIVVGLLALNAGVQLRSRGRRRAGFDALIAASGLALALGWGLLLGVLLHGVPLDADGHVHGFAPLRDPQVWFTALANVLLVLVHGAAFLVWRLEAGPVRERMRRLVARLGPAAGGVAVLVLGGWYLQAPPGIRHPVTGTVLALAIALAVVAAGLAAKTGGGRVFAASAVACALPVIAAASALFPAVLASTMDPGATVTVGDAAAGGDTLRLLALGAAPLLPVLVAVQAACWWLFRAGGRRRTSLYW
ncbi:cytochrome d ubiquinol oxidase subunit II [Dactylosporangium sp. NPDC048998]|uniref:cytochrome d ubiquinol oxidase subunit II n=1 Tax=Dactylosporangium sp. NPDC048998 TaxID=3363976 RepID=UPI0037113E00